MTENNYKDLREQLEKNIRSSRLRPSKEFKDVQSALNSLVELQDTDAKQDMEAAQERLEKACETYLTTREGAKSAKGQQRLDIVGSIYDLQQKDKEKMAANKPEAEHIPTVYEKLQEDLEASAKSRFSRPSKEFKDVLNTLRELNELNSKPMGEVSPGKMQNAYNSLAFACEKYRAEKGGAHTSKGQERYQTINQLAAITAVDKKFVDQAAGPEYAAENLGKTWAAAVANTRDKEVPKFVEKKEADYKSKMREKQEKKQLLDVMENHTEAMEEIDLGLGEDQGLDAWWDRATEIDVGLEDGKKPDQIARETEANRKEIPVRELENQEAAARKPARQEAGPARQERTPMRENISGKPLQRSDSQRTL